MFLCHEPLPFSTRAHLLVQAPKNTLDHGSCNMPCPKQLHIDLTNSVRFTLSVGDTTWAVC